MLDDALDYVEHIRERPVWQPIPGEVRARFRDPVPHAPSPLAEVHRRFLADILPYSTGNRTRGSWAGCTAQELRSGMLAEMLAASLNANLGGRDHIPHRSGTPDCPLDADDFRLSRERHRLVCDGRVDGEPHRRRDRPRCGSRFLKCDGAGVAASPRRLTAYTSAAVHTCISRAMDFLGLGKRCAPSDSRPSPQRTGWCAHQ